MTRLPGIGFWLGVGLWLVAAAARGADVAEGLQAYPHQAVRRQEFGVGTRSYWLFEPAGPTPPRAPVVVFHHGWFAVSPAVYGAWIEHLVRGGSIVVYPRYQADIGIQPANFLPNAVAAVRDAFQVLETTPGHVRPDRDRFALIGHSGGATLAVQMAAVARDQGLPRPRALVALMPGEVVRRPDPRLADIPGETLLVVIVGEDDLVVGDLRARQIFAETTAIPPDRKKYIIYRSDFHGDPPLIADHLAPAAYWRALDSGDGVMRGFQMMTAAVGPLDRVGFWRVTDVTFAAAFRGQTLDEATGKGALFRGLGSWSDGQAVIPPIVGDDLATLPRIYPRNGLILIDWSPVVDGERAWIRRP